MTSSTANDRLALLGLLVITAAVFARALCGEFVYDDVPLIVDNPAYQSLSDPWAIVSSPLWGDELGYWRPLTGLAFALGNTLGGVTGIHALALLIHLTAIAAGFFLAKDLTGNRTGAFFVAGLFALHPAHVESVAWATAINDPLWGLLALLALRKFARHFDGQRQALGMGFALFGFALLTKENALALLPVIAWLDFTRGSKGPRRPLYVGLIAVVAGYFLLRMLVFSSLDAGLGRAAINPAYTGSRMLTGPVEILGQLVQLIFVPWPLSPFRTLHPIGEPWTIVISAAWVLALIITTVFAVRRRWSLMAFGLGMVVLLLLPGILRFHALGSRSIQDRYLYLSVFAIALAFAPRGSSRPHTWIGISLTVLFGICSSLQIGVWATHDRLVAHGLDLYPQSKTVRAMRGMAALRRFRVSQKPEDLRAAEADFRALTDAAPPNLDGVRHVGIDDARIGLGWCALYRQDYPAATQEFKSVTNGPHPPADAHVGLAIALASQNRLQEAERHFLRAIEITPNNPAIHFNLGRLYGQTNRREQARHHLRRALELQPANAAARQLLDALE